MMSIDLKRLNPAALEPIRRRVAVALAGALVVALIAWTFAGPSTTEAEAQEEPEASATATVESRDLVEYTSIPGQIQYGDAISLNADGSGVLVYLPEAGSVVERGDALYLLSDEPEAVELIGAQSQVANAESQMASANSQAISLQEGAEFSQVASAQAALLSAESTLEELTDTPEPAEVSTAQSQVLSARQALDELISGPSAADASSAQAQLTQAASALTSANGAEVVAWNALHSAQSAYCLIGAHLSYVCGASDLPLTSSDVAALTSQVASELSAGDPDGIVVLAQALISSQVTYDNAVANVEVANRNQESAQASFDQVHEGPSDASVSSAMASVAAADQALSELLEGADNLSVRQTQASLTAAQASLSELLEGASPHELAAALASANSSSVSVDLAREQFAELLDTAETPVLLYGSLPMTRDLSSGAAGDDVKQIQLNLIQLGYGSDIEANGNFDEATVGAVSAWQTDLGIPVTGTVERNDVVFMSGPIRVDSWAAGTQIGEPVGSGGGGGDDAGSSASSASTLAQATPLAELPDDNPGASDDELQTTQQVVAELPVADRALLTAGDTVLIDLPDGTEVSGTVSQVSATTTEDAAAEEAWFDMLVELDEPADEIWIGTDIKVKVQSELAADVAAVPVSALVALVEDGYAVETVGSDGNVQLVGVETGMFADGYVEISGEIGVGDEVVIPR